MSALIHKHPYTGAIVVTGLYLILAYAISWTIWISLARAGWIVQRGDALPSHVPGLMGPMIAAVLVTWAVHGHAGMHDLFMRMTRWHVARRWWLAAFSPLAFFLVAIPIARMVDGQWPAWDAFDEMNGFPAAGVLVTWLLVTLLNGFGKETGWRGFATEHLQQVMPPLAATLIVAVFWAAWHAPVFFFVSGFKDYDGPMLAGFFFGMACGAVVLTWLYNRSGGSILIVAVWHGTYNIVSGSAGAEGTVQIVVSAFVIALAIRLIVQEVSAMRAREPSVIGPGSRLA